MKPVTIYALCSSRDHRVRYVGQTHQLLSNRIWYHQNRSVRAKTHLGRWMSSVKAKGHSIEVVVLQENAERNSAEIEWIAMLSDFGADLVNGTPGGDGFGNDRTQSHKDAIARALKGRQKSPEHCANLAAANRGKKLPPERAAQLAEARKKSGRRPRKPKAPMPEDVRRKISVANKGRVVGIETRQRMVASSRLRWTAEARAEAARKTIAANARKAAT